MLSFVPAFSDSSGSVPIDWGDVATWFQAIVTLALFIIGFIQIRTEREHRRKREAEGEIEAALSQAELVSGWIVEQGIAKGVREGESRERDVAWVAVSNESSQPVYQVVVSLYAISQTGDSLRGEIPGGRACILVVPPGRGYVQVGADYHGMSRLPGIEIGFQDRLSRAWARRPWGELVGLDSPTVHHYLVPLPTGWQALEDEVPLQEDWDPWSGVIDEDEWKFISDGLRDRAQVGEGADATRRI